MIVVPREERPHKWYVNISKHSSVAPSSVSANKRNRRNCRMYYGRRSRCKSRTPGRCYRVCRLRSVQCCRRFIHANGLKFAKGGK